MSSQRKTPRPSSIRTLRSGPGLLSIAFVTAVLANGPLEAQVRFTEDFENGLDRWLLQGEHAITILETADSSHRRVLKLEPDGGVRALIRGSDEWGGVRVDGEVFFPDDGHNYLGFIYNYTANDTRSDYGNIYIKGNGNYLRVNPWRDGNVSRLLYEEYRTPLEGKAAVTIGQWQRFRAEVIGNTCHFYVGEATVIPQLTFGVLELDKGLIGFEPRVVGAPVWIDNLTVTSIEDFSYDGSPIPAPAYEPAQLLTRWEVIGPLARPDRSIERGLTPDVRAQWRPFSTDARGAVITGRVTEWNGGRSIAYFRTIVDSPEARDAIVHFSTADELRLWVNGRFNGFVYRNGYLHDNWNAWFDFWKNPEHTGRRVPVRLTRGQNTIVVGVSNGQFASGGFYARLEP